MDDRERYDEPAAWAADDTMATQPVDSQRSMPIEEPRAWSEGSETVAAWELDPYASAPASAVQPPRAAYGPWIVAAAIVAALIIAGAIIFTMRDGKPQTTAARDRTEVSSARSGVSSQPGVVPSSSTRVSSQTPRSPAANQITFGAMRDFVIGLYGELPGNARDAWTKLDTGYQNQTGLSDYLDFWSTIESVNVVSVTPRDANSVVVRLTFVPRDGATNTEDRWLSVVLRNGVMLVYDSQRIGTVS
jgi:hypothetical protein